MTALPHPQPNLRAPPGVLSPPLSLKVCPQGLCHSFFQEPLALQGTLGLISPSMKFWGVSGRKGQRLQCHHHHNDDVLGAQLEGNRAKITSQDHPLGNSPTSPCCLALPSVQQGSGWGGSHQGKAGRGQIPDPGPPHLHLRWKRERLIPCWQGGRASPAALSSPPPSWGCPGRPGWRREGVLNRPVRHREEAGV